LGFLGTRAGIGAPFDIEVKDLGDRICLVELSGEADMSAAPELKAVVFGQLASGAHHVLIGLERITFIDSSILAVMIGVHKRVRQDGGSIQMVAPPTSVRDVVEVTGLDAVIPVADSVDEALAEISRKS
jgi:anti-sigma B factor antagonist